jgi:hypothetical protein
MLPPLTACWSFRDSFEKKREAVKFSFFVFPLPPPLNSFSLEVKKFCFTDSKGIKTSKGKKKNRRRKDPQKNASADESIESYGKV